MKIWKKGLLILTAAALWPECSWCGIGLFPGRCGFRGNWIGFSGKGRGSASPRGKGKLDVFGDRPLQSYSYTTKTARGIPGGNIAFKRPREKKMVWTISDHTMRINHSKHSLLSRERYSARQSLTLS